MSLKVFQSSIAKHNTHILIPKLVFFFTKKKLCENIKCVETRGKAEFTLKAIGVDVIFVSMHKHIQPSMSAYIFKKCLTAVVAI